MENKEKIFKGTGKIVSLVTFKMLQVTLNLIATFNFHFSLKYLRYKCLLKNKFKQGNLNLEM